MGKYIFGVDIGGTTVKLGFFDREGTLLDKWEIPTRTEDDGCNILPDVADSISEKLKEKEVAIEDVAGIGVGAPGPIDGEGVVHRAVNLGWGVFSIKKTLEDILHLPVMAGNDANVAALGEMWKGGGRGSRDLIMVTLGTGVGGGIITDGRILTGVCGAGGEIGHVHVEDAETESCNCGNYGCLEQYTSATGITRLANRKLAGCDKESVLRGGEVSAKTVFDAVKQKDALAMEIAEEFGKYLGDGLAVIASVINPDTIVIGGGVSRAGEILMDYIRPHYEKNVFHGSREVKFALATLGNDAGIYGSAKLVLDAVV
ncbi:ROK family protein [bacterium 1xD8-48]|jgi:glucokinase|nr:ROK family glucokinase [Lachnospiraceae bacterium]MCI9326300.1 ROK family glucokinase [Lachnospiraceae bacterium]NBJ98636.1 ROK family protein [bacterium 1xD8-48]